MAGPTGFRGYIPAGKIQLDEVEFVLRRRGPRRPTVGQTHQEEMMAYAAREGIGRATYPEATVHHALTERRLVDGRSFDFQSSLLGGRLELGGAVADFMFLDRPVILRVQGEHWHRVFDRMGSGTGDEEQKLALEARGWVVLDMWESDILNADWLEDFMRRNIDTPIVSREWQR